MSKHIRLGQLGEQIAVDFLRRRGVEVMKRNLSVGRGELDIVARDEAGIFAVEVKTGYDNDDFHPRWNFGHSKALQVARLAGQVGIKRVDLITVAVGRSGPLVEWHTRVI